MRKTVTILYILGQAWILLVSAEAVAWSDEPPESAARVYMDSCLHRADAYMYTNPDSALWYAQQALQWATTDTLAQADARYQMANAYIQKSQLAEGLALNLQIQPVFGASGDPLRLANGYRQAGRLYASLLDRTKAIQYHTKALSLFEHLQKNFDIAWVKAELGLNYMRLQQYSTALAYQQVALTYYLHIRDSSRIAGMWHNIGENYYLQHCYTQSMESYTRGIEWLPSGESYVRPYLYEGMARIYFVYGDWKACEHYGLLALRQLKTDAARNADRVRLSKIYEFLYTFYRTRKNYGKAVFYLEKMGQEETQLIGFEKGKEIAHIQYTYELEKQRLFIESLDKNKKLQKMHLQQKQLQIILLTAGILCSLALAGAYFWSAYIRKRNNKLLSRKNREIAQKKTAIELFVGDIQSMNQRLKTVNEHLDDRVQEQTEALRQQNTRLIEYQFINAHKVRGPLARILGLVSLIRACELSAYPTELIGLLERSALDLDLVVHEIRNLLTDTHPSTESAEDRPSSGPAE